jgi:MFS family permease
MVMSNRPRRLATAASTSAGECLPGVTARHPARLTTRLIGARALQGFGAALIPPAALSILAVTFAEGAERNRALGR